MALLLTSFFTALYVLKRDFHKSEAQDQDYIEYRSKSPAEIILTIQRNLFTLQLNPIVFFIVNFILLSYLYDKHYVHNVYHISMKVK